MIESKETIWVIIVRSPLKWRRGGKKDGLVSITIDLQAILLQSHPSRSQCCDTAHDSLHIMGMII